MKEIIDSARHSELVSESLMYELDAEMNSA